MVQQTVPLLRVVAFDVHAGIQREIAAVLALSATERRVATYG